MTMTAVSATIFVGISFNPDAAYLHLYALMIKHVLIFLAGNAMTLMLLLAGLNSCTNPWIYLAFSDNLYRQVMRCLGRGNLERRSTVSSMRNRSMMRSVTEVSRLDSINADSRF